MAAAALVTIGSGGSASAAPGEQQIYFNLAIQYFYGGAKSPVRPPKFEVSNLDDREIKTDYRYSDLKWSSWGGDVAQATGNLNTSIYIEGKGEKDLGTFAVTMQASRPADCVGQRVYTHYDVALLPGSPTPPDFEKLKSRDIPCSVSVNGGYVGGLSEHRQRTLPGKYNYRATGDCLLPDLRRTTGQRPYWKLACRMKWSGWGKVTTAGTGVARKNLRRGIRDFAMRTEMSRPVWCSGAGMSYSRKRVTVYGTGIEHNSVGAVPLDIEKRLRRQLGHRPIRVYHESLPKTALCDPAPN